MYRGNVEKINSILINIFFILFKQIFLPLFKDLLPSDSYTPTLHLVAYSVNQKGRSEPTVLEDIAINEAEKRTGMYTNTNTRKNGI